MSWIIQDTRLYLTNSGPSKGIQRCCTRIREEIQIRDEITQTKNNLI